MPLSMSTEQKVGMFFLMALIALGVMIELVEDWRPFEVRNEYQTYFKSAIGIQPGDPVRQAGVGVGKIKGITIEDSRVRIDFYVTEGTVVRDDSEAQIRQTNLLGGQFLGLTFGSELGKPLPPGSTVPGRESANIDELITSFDRNQERVFGALGDLVQETREPLVGAVTRMDSIISKIDEGEGTLGRLVNEPALYDEVKGAMAGLNSTLTRIEQGEGTLGRLMNDDTLYTEATATVANLRQISDRIKEGQGSVGKLIVEDTFYDNASDALANIRDISAKANDGTGTLGLLVNDDTLYHEATGTMTRINSIAAKIDEGDGSLGRLVNEDDLYRDAKTTLHKVEKAVDGMSDTGPLQAMGVVIGTLF